VSGVFCLGFGVGFFLLFFFRKYLPEIYSCITAEIGLFFFFRSKERNNSWITNFSLQGPDGAEFILALEFTIASVLPSQPKPTAGAFIRWQPVYEMQHCFKKSVEKKKDTKPNC